MPLRQSIAFKIFSLAVGLLVLTVTLAIYLLLQAARSRHEMEVVVQLDLPLARQLSMINEHGLRRRLAFERWYATLNSAEPNAEVISEASQNYSKFTVTLHEELRIAGKLLDNYDERGVVREELGEFRLLLKEMESAYVTINQRQQALLELQRTGQRQKANEQINMLEDLMRMLQEARSLAQEKAENMSAVTGLEVAERQRTVQTLAIAATVSTVLLGLASAALVTNRLTRPVRSLVGALRDVRHGNLAVQLPVGSSDEVGVLTESFNFFVRELKEKDEIKRTFGKYVDPRIVDRVLGQQNAAMMAGEKQVMTILFADLVGFTSISERLTPRLMVEVLNRHFGLQAAAVQANGGVVDKFIGDSVMAFWGPPFTPVDEHPLMACRAALAMKAAVQALALEIPDITGMRRDAPRVELKIGLATGEVVVGSIGSENTRSYTVIGDTVNLASRVESTTRLFGVGILVTDETVRTAGGEFEFREIDAVAVKGKDESVRLFELLALRGELGELDRQLGQHYARGLTAYRSQEWDAAEAAFQECLHLKASDKPAQVMLGRIPALRREPPPKDWNTVYVLSEK